jgi:hypothetical protein
MYIDFFSGKLNNDRLLRRQKLVSWFEWSQKYNKGRHLSKCSVVNVVCDYANKKIRAKFVRTKTSKLNNNIKCFRIKMSYNCKITHIFIETEHMP